ncbi:MAG: hypothetical protein QXN59_01675 [Candidatus Micrarchaeaceae archaeon]
MKVGNSAIAYGIIAIFVIVVVYTAIYFTILNTSASVEVHMSITNATNVYPYNISYIRINVTNTGGKLIKGLLLNVYVNDVSKKLYTLTIPVKKTAELNFSYIYNSPGNYSFSALANPGDILNLSKSSITLASQTVRVRRPQSPIIADYLPNLHGGYTKNIALSAYGVSVAPALFSQYSLGPEVSIMSNRTSSIEDIISHLSSVESLENAYTANNSILVGQAWIQGTSPSILAGTMEGLGFSELSPLSNGSVRYLYKGNTSACIYFQDGWTKLVYVINNGSATCANYYAYPQNLSAIESVTNEINASRYLSNSTALFTYANSSQVGGIIFKNATTLSLSNIFANSYGIFISTLSKTHNYKNGSYVCYGLLNYNNSICTIYGIALNSSFKNFSLVESEMDTPNYTVSIYSIVPVGETSAAYLSGVKLIKHLNITEEPYEWVSAFSDSCTLNAKISCKVVNWTVNSAELNFTNNMNSTIRLDSLACYLSIPSALSKIGESILPGKSLLYNATCSYGAIGSFGIISNYTLQLNYTINGKNETANGYLKLSELS